MDSLSYSLGILMADNLRQQGFDDLNAADISKGIMHVIDGKDLQISLPQANEIVQGYLKKQRNKQYEKAIAEGKAFLESNAKRPEVTVTESGLQYEVLKAGDGPKPKPTDKVRVHYHGTLTDGTVFDSSVQRGEPSTFGVTQVIQGWVEGLQLMPTGSKWKFYIP